MHRRAGTIVFFKHRPWLARTRPGREALRVAHVWLPILRRELAETRAALKPKPQSVPAIICAVFGPDCSKALSVARCESGFSVYATNGQYRGIFQMGSGERERFGDGPDAWSQARAAYAYFRLSGWGPWQCA